MNKKCRYEFVECLGSGKCVCCLIFLMLLIAYFFCNQGYDFIEFCSEVLCWEMVTAISTLIAAYLAYKAYNNSVRMRRQASFDSVFSQLLVNGRLTHLTGTHNYLNEPSWFFKPFLYSLIFSSFIHSFTFYAVECVFLRSTKISVWKQKSK